MMYKSMQKISWIINISDGDIFAIHLVRANILLAVITWRIQPFWSIYRLPYNNMLK